MGMMGISLRWFINDAKGQMKWWKILLFVIVTAALVVFNSDELSNPYLWTYWTFYLTSFICKLVIPKFKKINFLLPQDEKSRRTYIITSSVAILLFMILWYISINLLCVVLGFYSIRKAALKLLCRDIILLTLIIAFCVTEFYSPMPETTKDGINTKRKKTGKEKQRTIYLILFIVYSALHVLFGQELFPGLWYGISTILAYPCSLAVTYFILSDVSKSNLTYETIRKPVKVF